MGSLRGEGVRASCESAEGPRVLPLEDPSSFHAQMELYVLVQP